MWRPPLFLLAALLAQLCLKADEPSLLDQGYRQMYNLQFDAAHRSFQEWAKSHPTEPMGPVSDAAAYLFAEFDRLHILESEFFVDDSFRSHQKLAPDAAVRERFEQALNKGQQLADRKLAQFPQDHEAMFANVMRMGLHADYRALIEKKYAAALDEMKAGRLLAQQLVTADPAFYDAYLAIGVENYLLSQKIAPLRWFLRISGAQTDKDEGLRNLRLTAEKGHYLLPYARLLLAVAALRDGDSERAAATLRDLVLEFPNNRLYAQELLKLAPRPKKTS
ncbi:MAG: hypothetical protein JWO19_5166 [Bryobacterales bacterium]|nr:hypothetical protein [Bryobacterales bacterium]